MKMPTTTGAQFSFARVPDVKLPRSVFDRSCGHKTTIKAGYLYPLLVDLVYPGDTMAMRSQVLGRLTTPVVPIMDNLYLDLHYFFTPLRLLWNNFERFMGAQDDPTDSVDYTLPQFAGHVVAAGSLSDYMGIPVGTGGNIGYVSLFHRNYNLVWNTWYRDQSQQDSVVVDKDDGTDSIADYVLLRRGKRHDYFTGCLPAPQRGTGVTLPLGTSADVAVTGVAGDDVVVWDTAAGVYKKLDAGNPFVELSATAAAGPRLFADLSLATAASINQLRQAIAIQHILENNARGGTRYIELIRARWGVRSSDARLQRPEYLGGHTTPIAVSAIAQTSSTDAESPQANLAAIGTVNVSDRGFARSFEEHGILMVLASVRADLTYQQGIPRMFKYLTKYDMFNPELGHIGEQAVLRREIYMTGTTAEDETVFGYTGRYDENRYKPSMVTGLMRSNHVNTLEAWHLAQEFGSAPTLGPDFIVEDPPLSRVLAVEDEDHLKIDAYFSYRCARVMPLFGVPGLMRL